MASPLLSLPYELRVYIYELVLCTQGSAQLMSPKTKRRRKLPPIGYDQIVFRQPPVAHYPPGGSEQVDELDDRIEPIWLVEGHASDRTGFRHLLPDSNDPTGNMSESAGYVVENYGIYFGKDGEIELECNELGYGTDDSTPWGSDSGSSKGSRSIVDEDDVEDASDLADGSVCDNEDVDANSPRPYLERFGYEISAFKPLETALLRTCREINTDATPFVYAGINFVLDTSPIRAMRFLKTLPAPALRNITTITLPPAILDYFDELCEAGWSPDGEFRAGDGLPVMYTPFSAFLNAEMPKLSDIYAYKLMEGDRGLSCRWAWTELERLLCHGRIQRLHYVSMGEEAAHTLRAGWSSELTMRTLIDGIGTCAASREFNRHHDLPQFQGYYSGEGRLREDA